MLQRKWEGRVNIPQLDFHAWLQGVQYVKNGNGIETRTLTEAHFLWGIFNNRDLSPKLLWPFIQVCYRVKRHTCSWEHHPSPPHPSLQSTNLCSSCPAGLCNRNAFLSHLRWAASQPCFWDAMSPASKPPHLCVVCWWELPGSLWHTMICIPVLYMSLFKNQDSSLARAG